LHFDLVKEIDSLFSVPKGITFDSLFFYAEVVPDMIQQFSAHSQRKSRQGLQINFYLHGHMFQKD
jgi:hypothetical protein